MTFTFDLGATIDFDLEDIWCDGDAPENPTAEDVAKVIKECGGLRRVIQDWDLDRDLVLHISGNNTHVTVR